MDVRKVVAAHSLLVGVMMAAMWTVFAVTDQIPGHKPGWKKKSKCFEGWPCLITIRLESEIHHLA